MIIGCGIECPGLHNAVGLSLPMIKDGEDLESYYAVQTRKKAVLGKEAKLIKTKY